MNRNLTFIICIVAATSVFSCIDSKTKKENAPEDVDFRSVEINQEYRLRLPRYMTETTGLNPEASLQFQNIEKNTFSLVIEESKSEFVRVFKEAGLYNSSIPPIENYRKAQLKLLSERMNITKEGTPAKLEINGMPAEMVELDGKVYSVDEELSYFLTFVEGGEKIYLIMSWTTARQKDDYRNTFSSIGKSFEMIN